MLVLSIDLHGPWLCFLLALGRDYRSCMKISKLGKNNILDCKATEMTWNEDQISLLCQETISEIHVLYLTVFLKIIGTKW